MNGYSWGGLLPQSHQRLRYGGGTHIEGPPYEFWQELFKGKSIREKEALADQLRNMSTLAQNRDLIGEKALGALHNINLRVPERFGLSTFETSLIPRYTEREDIDQPGSLPTPADTPKLPSPPSRSPSFLQPSERISPPPQAFLEGGTPITTKFTSNIDELYPRSSLTPTRIQQQAKVFKDVGYGQDEALDMAIRYLIKQPPIKTPEQDAERSYRTNFAFAQKLSGPEATPEDIQQLTLAISSNAQAMTPAQMKKRNVALDEFIKLYQDNPKEDFLSIVGKMTPENRGVVMKDIASFSQMINRNKSLEASIGHQQDMLSLRQQQLELMEARMKFQKELSEEKGEKSEWKAYEKHVDELFKQMRSAYKEFHKNVKDYPSTYGKEFKQEATFRDWFYSNGADHYKKELTDLTGIDYTKAEPPTRTQILKLIKDRMGKGGNIEPPTTPQTSPPSKGATTLSDEEIKLQLGL